MTFKEWRTITNNNKITIIVTTIIIMVLVLGINLIQPFKYKASTRLLVIQKQSIVSDSYQAFRSAERIGNNLSQIIYTDSFYEKAVAMNSDITKYFPRDEEKRRKAWQKTIKSKNLAQTSMLQIEAYYQDKQIAKSIASIISQVLITQGNEYLGIASDSIQIKQVDSTLVSKFPAQPKIVQNMILALILGLVASNIIVITFSKWRKQRLSEYFANLQNYDSHRQPDFEENQNQFSGELNQKY